MATTKKTTTTKATTAKKTTTRKTTAKKKVEPVAERSVFELMAEKFPITETEVETPVGVVKVKDRISMNDMIVLINMIVEMCTDRETGEVKWEIHDFATKVSICSTYCGISVPQDIDIAYAATCGKSGLYEVIKDCIDPDQLNCVWDSVTDKLNSRDELNCSTAVGKLNEFLKNMDELMHMISEMSEHFDEEEAVKALGNLSVLTGAK